MYRIMFPNGRLVETSEIIFVSGDSVNDLKTARYSDASGIVFRCTSGHYWVHSFTPTGAFGTSLGSVWNSLLTRSYQCFADSAFSGKLNAERIPNGVYESLEWATEDIS